MEAEKDLEHYLRSLRHYATPQEFEAFVRECGTIAKTRERTAFLDGLMRERDRKSWLTGWLWTFSKAIAAAAATIAGLKVLYEIALTVLGGS